MKLLIICLWLIGLNFQLHSEEYKLISKAIIGMGNGIQKVKIISDVNLQYKAEKDKYSFTLGLNQLQVWAQPRSKEREDKAKEAGTPIDGTRYTPKSEKKSFHFNNKAKKLLKYPDQISKDQPTIDLLNLVFFKGKKGPFLSRDFLIMQVRYAKPYKYTIDGFQVTLYVYSHQRLIEDNIKEAPTYMVTVEDEKKKMQACRVTYQVFDSTGYVRSESDFLNKKSKVNLDDICKKVNKQLDVAYKLKSLDWKKKLSLGTIKD